MVQRRGGPSAASRRRLATLAKTLEEDGDLVRARIVRLKPGARLIREWHGETHTVIVNQNDCVELYDLVNDPDETTNIREGNSDIGGPLRSGIQKRLRDAKWLR